MLSEMLFSQYSEIMVVVVDLPISLLVRTSHPTNLRVVEVGESHPTNLKVEEVEENHHTNLQEEENLQMEVLEEVSYSH